MEQKVERLEKELEEAREIILILCEKVEALEASAEKALSLYDKVKNNPLIKTMLR